jgi:hypothetical protein
VAVSALDRRPITAAGEKKPLPGLRIKAIPTKPVPTAQPKSFGNGSRSQSRAMKGMKSGEE